MNQRRPLVRFFLADEHHPVVRGNAHWGRGLPSDRAAAGHRGNGQALTCGEYFEAVARFLSRDGWRAVRNAAAVLDRCWPKGAMPCRVDIFLEKHGAFYHPCRVAVGGDQRCVELVVNVALSSEGRTLLPAEVALIDRLDKRFGLGCLPVVFGWNSQVLDDGRRLEMFLGQWFSDFHEFHLTLAADQEQVVVVWAPRGPISLDSTRRQALYRQAATLLAGHYDVFSAEQILDWHHAAGDFVIRLDDGGRLDLRLVTVRHYGALINEAPDDLETTLAALALFVVHTTLWLRLDRCDGVGDLMLAGLETLAPALAGIFDALEGKVNRGEMPAGMLTAAAVYLSARSRLDFYALIMAMAARRPATDRTRCLLEQAAPNHAQRLQSLLAAGTRSHGSGQIPH